VNFVRVFIRREKWPVVMPIANGRQCPDCLAVVIGPEGQRGHGEWHQEIEERFNDLDSGRDPRRGRVPSGYVVGSGLDLARLTQDAEGEDGGADSAAFLSEE
jgi:hypothetical protein